MVSSGFCLHLSWEFLIHSSFELTFYAQNVAIYILYRACEYILIGLFRGGLTIEGAILVLLLLNFQINCYDSKLKLNNA